jgi:adenosylmethionine-8-amino-7-oxononanoate aminotransferase
MRDWLKAEPIILVEGKGAVLRDIRGRTYLDANSSIWTNLHGHNHSKINAAIQKQLRKLAHSSALGFANGPASLLAQKLVEAANPDFVRRRRRREQIDLTLTKSRHSQFPAPLPPRLQKVFFSDDGSTAMEVALKLAYEYARRTGRSQRPKFLSLEGAYHGDTVGAVSLGHIDLFHKAYRGLLFKSDAVMAPYCYRCPFNRAKPERADAREYRRCNWECIDKVEQKFAAQRKKGNPYAALIVEPLIQGAAGMIPQPQGWLNRASQIARADGAQLIADEVMTGFGRTSFTIPSTLNPRFSPSLFACHGEQVQPDFLALAKGLTGGYLPMAATLTTQAVFDVFLGDYAEFKTFFHGHSYTGNQLGAAAALASLEILSAPASVRARQKLEKALRVQLQTLWALPNVGDIRQAGLIVGVELVNNWRTRKPFELSERAGIRVCEAMARRGVLTRPVGNVVVLMPPYCTTERQATHIVSVLREAVTEVFGKPKL